jgi:catechol 2,3-dioxygenase-like lactoylglutathione lyase family enzyme
MKLIYLFLSALLPMAAAAQMKPQTSPPKKQAHTNTLPASPQFVAVFVHQFDSTLKWYTDKLGFEIVSQGGNKAQGAAFAVLKWGAVHLEMIAHPKVVRRADVQTLQPGNIGVQGFFKPGIYVEELERLQKELKEKGVTIKYPIQKNDNLKMNLFIIEDAEGNLLQFFNFVR